MCGIYGYIGKLNAFNEVYAGLERLQYRGYDSCGIAYLHNNSLKITKAVGTLKNILNPQIKCNLSFGHTRWATNGKVNIQNAHPHLSYNKQFAIVHNGIIYNASQLKAKLENSGVQFCSDTDTEVIANLLACLPGEPDERIKSLFNYLEGSFALIIYHNKTIYLVKKFNPLNILINDDGIYISSDINSLKSGKLYSLKDNDILKIKDGKIAALVGNVNFKNYTNNIQNYNLGSYSHYMLKEIYEIPASIEDTYNYIKDINFKPYFKNIKEITLIGCGTAYHSCLVGAEMLKKLNFSVKTELASNYEVNKKIKRTQLHIIVSQSGETADCIKVAKQIKAKCGKILVITNESKSSLVQYANYVILTKAQKEIAVASTKTYCSQVFVFAYITKKLKNINYSINIKKLNKSLSHFIKKLNIEPIAKELKNMSNTILIGKDVDYLTLLEASLKIREIDYVYTIPIYAGELKHGTLSLIDSNSVVLALNTSKTKTLLNNAINEIESRGGKVVEFDKFLPNKLYRDYITIYSIIPFQLLSYYIALEKHYNPDMPRNLAKSVTVE